MMPDHAVEPHECGQSLSMITSPREAAHSPSLNRSCVTTHVVPQALECLDKLGMFEGSHDVRLGGWTTQD